MTEGRRVGGRDASRKLEETLRRSHPLPSPGRGHLPSASAVAPAAKKNFGDMNDFVAQEALTAEAYEERDQALKERDDARAEAVKLGQQLQLLQKLGAHTPYTAASVTPTAPAATTAETPSEELLTDYRDAKKSIRGGAAGGYSLQYQQDALRAQALASVIADIVAGEPENRMAAILIAQDDARRRAFAPKKE